MADPIFSWTRVKAALGGDAFKFVTGYLVKGKFDANDNLIGFINPRTEADVNVGSGNVTQNITRANIIAALDFTAGNIVNVTDNLPAGVTLIAEPVMPASVKVGDRFELFFNKLQATQCTVQFPSTPTNLSYPFNNGTQAHIAFEWSGTRLVEV